MGTATMANAWATRKDRTNSVDPRLPLVDKSVAWAGAPITNETDMANNIHVSYDLYQPGQNYEDVITKIKSLGNWAKIHKSFWYLDTSLSAEQVAKAVWSVMDHE